MTTKRLVQNALMIALLGVSAYISVPLPWGVPITGQTLVVNLIALSQKKEDSLIIVTLYLLLGAVGLPIFSGGKAGLAVLFGPTGGFLFSYIPAVALMGILLEKVPNRPRIVKPFLIAVTVGMPVIYGFGLLWLKYFATLTWSQAFAAAVLPFIPGDIAKAATAAILADRLRVIRNTQEA